MVSRSQSRITVLDKELKIDHLSTIIFNFGIHLTSKFVTPVKKRDESGQSSECYATQQSG